MSCQIALSYRFRRREGDLELRGVGASKVETN
jgi:hypothetical protein